MTDYFVTRHAGASEWATRNGFNSVEVVAHFDPAVVNEGDKVIGTLPVHLAADVCGKGGQYYHLVLNLPADARGREISADDMESYGATVEQFIITRA